MSDPVTWQSILSGVLTGSGSAMASILAVFRDLKNRLTALENKLGKDGSEPGTPKTGIYLMLDHLTNLVTGADHAITRFRREVDAWDEVPPEWLVRLVTRTARSTSVNLEHHQELVDLVERRYKANANRLSDLEDKIEALEKRYAALIDRGEYERDKRERAEELGKIREGIASANGVLRGVMELLNYMGDEGRKKLGK